MFCIFVHLNNKNIKAEIIGKIHKVLLMLYEAGCGYTGVCIAAITNVVSIYSIFKQIRSIGKMKEKNKHFS